MATPPYSAVWNTTNGAWATAASWTETQPTAGHHVPNSNNAVSIVGSSAIVVTFTTTAEIWSLSGSNATINMTGGGSQLTIDHDSVFNGLINMSLGTYLSAAINMTVTFAGGAINGVLTGNGTIKFQSGAFSLNGATLGVDFLVLGVDGDGFGSTTTLNSAETDAHAFTLDTYHGNNATLNLNSQTLTLTNNVDKLLGTISGTGTVLVTSTNSQNTTSANITNGAKLEIAGSISQVGNMNLAGTLQVDQGGAFTITTASQTTDGGQTNGTSSAAQYVNNGIFEDAATGVSTVYGWFTNNSTGRVTVDGGAILQLVGTNTLGGTITGSGELLLASGTTTINSTNVSVLNLVLNGGNAGGTTTLGVDLSYAYIFNFSNQFGTLALNGHTLTLSGVYDALAGGNISGVGTVLVTGAASVGFITVGYQSTAATIEDAGTMTQTGGVSLNGTLQIDGSGTYAFTADTYINDNGATIINNGIFIDEAAGGSNVNGAFVNNGTLAVYNGALLTMFSSSITGSGSAQIGGGGTLYTRGGSFQQNVSFTGAGRLTVSQAYNGVISNFKTEDQVAFSGFLSYAPGDHVVLQAAAGGVETFAIENSSNQLLTTVNLAGSYQASQFDLSTDSFGELVFSYGHGVDKSDFNLDGYSDIIFQQTSGSVALWEMNGPSIIANGASVLANTGPAWKPIGSGDFYGDGKADLLLEDTSGDIAYWAVNQSGSGPVLDPSHTLQLSLLPGSAWTADAIGDFNGDGMSDIVLQNVDGSVALWEMNGASLVANGASVLANPGTDWHVRGAGDFYDNGTSDILLQRDDGTMALWGVMPGGSGPTLDMSTTTALATSLNPGPSWVVKGVGDFNGDGLADIVFQNSTTGDVAIWEMNGANLLTPTSATVISPGSNWHLTSVADYNGDGKSDLLLQNSNDGSLAMWFMNGLSLLPSTTQLAASPGLSWTPSA